MGTYRAAIAAKKRGTKYYCPSLVHLGHELGISTQPKIINLKRLDGTQWSKLELFTAQSQLVKLLMNGFDWASGHS